MTNSKPVIDNKEKAKSRKKRDPLQIHLDRLTKLRYEDSELSGEDIAAYADALAAAKQAQKSIDATVKEAEGILKAAMLRQYCEHYSQTGRAPDLRQPVSHTGTFQVIQQNVAKVTTSKANELKGQGIDLEQWKEKNSFTIRMGNASKEESKKIIAAMKEILGDGFDDVVSEYTHVGEKFFGSFDDIVKKSMAPGERLDEKMLGVIRVLNPTISFTKFKSDLEDKDAYGLAFEFARVTEEKKKAAEAARKQARRSA